MLYERRVKDFFQFAKTKWFIQEIMGPFTKRPILRCTLTMAARQNYRGLDCALH